MEKKQVKVLSEKTEKKAFFSYIYYASSTVCPSILYCQ